MQLLTLGLNHTIAGLALRERVAVAPERLGEALGDLRAQLGTLVPEVAILSTCNRTELYCAVHDPAAAHEALIDWLAAGSAVSADELRSHLYALPQRDAARHAFRVASGLDSMILGEPHILGQMKEAARRAQAAGTLGTHLHRLFQHSFAVAKEVRSRTEIGSRAVSMAAVAVRLAQRVFDGLRDTRVLFVGAGKMIELAVTHFAAQHPREMTIASRTPERAERLARRFGAQTMHLAELPGHLQQFDIVVSGTSSCLPLIGLGMVERASEARGGRPLCILDLALPRDVEPEAGRLNNVFLYTLDDLGEVAQLGVDARRSAVTQAEAIIDTRVDGFMHWMSARQAVPLLCTLEERAGRLRAGELNRARRLLARGERPEAALEALAAGLANKFLHGPRRLLGRGRLAQQEARRLVEQWLPVQATRRDRERARGPQATADALGTARLRAPLLSEEQAA
jgi:glutamyl-tRNA reductase